METRNIKRSDRFGGAKDMVMVALMAALIFVVTFTVRIPIPASGGYINIGDAIIFLSAWLIGGNRRSVKTAFAVAASAAIGSALADLSVGAAIYIIPTFIIKGVMGLLARLIILKHRNFLFFMVASAACGAVMVAGYFLFDYLFMGFAYALPSLSFNCIQWAGCVAAAGALFPVVRRVESLM